MIGAKSLRRVAEHGYSPFSYALRKESQEMNDLMIQQEDFATRCQKVLQVARQLYQGNPDWVTFFREVLGVNGAARSVFPNQNEFVSFEKSAEYGEIQKMVAGLRGRKIPGNNSNEPTRVITVRLPESLHEALKAEASDHNTSMNKLCISKLLQVLIENERVAAAAASTQKTQCYSLPHNRSRFQPSTQHLQVSDLPIHRPLSLARHHLASGSSQNPKRALTILSPPSRPMKRRAECTARRFF